MAFFKVSVVAITTDHPRVLWSAEFEKQFISDIDPRLRQLPINGSFLDLGAVLSRSEVIELADKFFARESRNKPAGWESYLANLRRTVDELHRIPESDWIIYAVRYWEEFVWPSGGD